MGTVLIAGIAHPIDAPVVDGRTRGWDATQPRCIKPARPCVGDFPYEQKGLPYTRRHGFRPGLASARGAVTLGAVQAVITQFVFHHDGLEDAASCWEVLHNERGLSCHFLCDNDGTIYQTLDLALMAYHAAEFNPASIGVEISNRGDASDRNYYAKRGQAHDRRLTECEVNGARIACFDFTPAQYKALQALCRGLTRLLPNLPVEFPQSSPGQLATRTLDNPFAFKGYVGHYHLTQQKWDPGPFDFKTFCAGLRGQRCFPVAPRPGAEPVAPVVPARDDERRAALAALYARNEVDGAGGYFPVGPWGEHGLWHGGIHLHGAEREPAFACFAGRLVAARIGATSPNGQVDFALVRHDMSVGTTAMRFFALYMHLADETRTTDAGRPPWLGRDAWRLASAKAQPGEVVLFDDPVQAGEVIGRLGRAGPDAQPQLHLEFLADAPLFEELRATPGNAIDPRTVSIDGSSTGRMVTPELLAELDTAPRDGDLSRRELVGFYTAPGARDQHRLKVTFHVSEWSGEPSWADELAAAPGLHALPREAIDQLVADQITPAVFWSPAFAAHTGLPAGAVVHHFHPIHFIGVIAEAQAAAAAIARTQAAGPAGGVPPNVTDDRGGEGMITKAQAKSPDPSDALTFEDLVNGYP
ncbi:MAG: N-acetylmuramoyl-L-alanine amidase [Deltaproteobacteria bacterium]|nr:N-acetylmuramoyl-L-alanine amidase [Deltaproteobacteria bacterium]